MRLNREQPGDIFERIAQIDIQLLEFELAGFDFREVQNVVDDGQQRRAAVADGLCVITLQAVKLRVEQELGHAEHAVHRRADLVAHVREKFALRAIGGFCNLLGPEYLERGRLQVGEVEHDAVNFRRLAANVAVCGNSRTHVFGDAIDDEAVIECA